MNDRNLKDSFQLTGMKIKNEMGEKLQQITKRIKDYLISYENIL
jgi:hypothetical protein